MKLNNARIRELLGNHNMTQNQLARQIDISRGFLSNALSGKRGVGRKMLAGLIRVFPDEDISTLTIS